MAKTRKLKRNWSICDLKILIWLICKHCEQTAVPVSDVHNHDDSWQLISSLIPGTCPESCLFKWLSLRRYKITLHGWSEQEEQILLRLEKYAPPHAGSMPIPATSGSSSPRNSTLSTPVPIRSTAIPSNVGSTTLVSSTPPSRRVPGPRRRISRCSPTSSRTPARRSGAGW